MAGPVRNDHVTFTNLGWVIDGRSIETSFSIPSVKLINDFVVRSFLSPPLQHLMDFRWRDPADSPGLYSPRSRHYGQAVGYGLLTLRKDQYQELQAGEHDPAGPIACVGAGTGLGEVCPLLRLA